MPNRQLYAARLRVWRHTPGFVTLVLGALLLVLGGCSQRTTPTPTPVVTVASVTIVDPAAPLAQTTATAATTVVARAEPVATPTPVTGSVELWHSWSQADGDALVAILLDMADTHPDLRVETLFVAQADLLSGYAEAVHAGAGPDLLLAPNVWLRELVTLDVIDGLEDTSPMPVSNDYWPAALQGMQWQERVYGFPITMHTVAMFYNQRLVPDGNVPTTTAELLRLAQAEPRTGTGIYNNLFHLYWGIPAYGGELIDGSGRAVLEQTEGATQYLAWLADLNQTPGSYVSADYGMLLDRFKKQEFTYFVDGLWSTTDLHITLGEDLHAVPLPNGPVGPAQPWTYMDGLFFNPNQSPAQRALSLVVASMISGEAAGVHLATIANALPANRHVALSDDILIGFQAQAATAAALPLRAEMEHVWGAGGDMFSKVVEAGRSPQEVVLETSTLINEANGR